MKPQRLQRWGNTLLLVTGLMVFVFAAPGLIMLPIVLMLLPFTEQQPTNGWNLDAIFFGLLISLLVLCLAGGATFSYLGIAMKSRRFLFLGLFVLGVSITLIVACFGFGLWGY